MHNFKQLQVWQKAMEMVKEVYLAIAEFPVEERYGLAQQLRRSAVSIPSNIAEGAGRGGEKEFAHFLNISLGSAYEVETQLILANQLNLLSTQQLQKIDIQMQQVQKMLFSLILKFTKK